MNNNTTICIDLAKNVFQVAVFNQAGKASVNIEVSASKMCKMIQGYPSANIFMEACGSAHFWGRYFTKLDHKVGLIPPHIAAKYRTGNKNDKNDALAIFEASKNAQLHTVQIRSLEQQDMATLHKVREAYKKDRNAIANRIRGFAREYGVNFPLSLASLRKQLLEQLENAENEFTVTCRKLLRALLDQLIEMSERFQQLTKELEHTAKQNDVCVRLTSLPGIALLSASMLHVKLGSGDSFKRGRDASASLGVVPSHSGSGGKVMMGGITKRGDVYLRSLLVNGARSVVSNIRDKMDGLSCWIRNLLKTKSFNTTVVAVVNKLIRMALAMLKSGEEYRPPVAQA